MKLMRVDPMSAGRVLGVLSVPWGLLFGLLMTLMSLAPSSPIGEALSEFPLMSLIFGVGSVILMPIMYGVSGFLQGLIGAVLYNFVADWVGGIHMEFEQ